MKSALIISIILCGFMPSNYGQPKGQSKKIDRYLSFLKDNSEAGADYIFRLFEDNYVVVLCERDHAEVSQYDFIAKLLSDPRFVNDIGNVFVEVGGSNWKPEYDARVLSEIPKETAKLDEEIFALQRNISFYPLCNNFSYNIFLSSVCNINRDLDRSQKINI